MTDLRSLTARFQSTLRPARPPSGGAVASALAAAVRDIEARDLGGALWQGRVGAWSDDPGVQASISNRLGWLRSPEMLSGQLDRLAAFADRVRIDGFTDVVLLGMGGSSLAPEVLRAVVGSAPGAPRFRMLDSVDPEAVRRVFDRVERTLFLFASKSGGTIEPNVLAAEARRRLEQAGISRWGDHFVAITDEGTALHQIATRERYRDVFVNPSDIGGRYSALSFFGFVPAALMGLDLVSLLAWGRAMLAASQAGGVLDHPALALAVLMGGAARAGRDKLTLVVPPALEPFGLWVEQLVAESTGKHGVGVVPIAGEPPLPRYGADRAFVRIRLAGEPAAEALDAVVTRAADAGAPTFTIAMPEPLALGAEFVRWEIATAVTGALLGINPFDEPNVQQAKDATKTLLGGYAKTSRLPEPAADASVQGAVLTLSGAAREHLDGRSPREFLALLGEGDYFGVLAYLDPATPLGPVLQAWRSDVALRTGCATMLGFGPRYLHSTGQLHKGGPNTGVFVVVTAGGVEDLPVPGEPYSFATLELAQALGDFDALDRRGRRALRVHLPDRHEATLAKVVEALLATWRDRSMG